MHCIEKDSFVVISDLHSVPWTIEKITDVYLNKFDKIFILGDVTDRGYNNDGYYGLDMLLKIKELSLKYPGRIIYLPGNHDYFLLKYSLMDSSEKKEFRELQMLNGGYYTYANFEYLKRKNKDRINSLMDWLSNLPLQYVHEFNGDKFALAHAFFNMSVYRSNPSASMNDYLLNKELYKNILWFRKGPCFKYDSQDVPCKDYKIIVGHTPPFARRSKDLGLIGADGSYVDVYCVDNGVFFEERELGVYDCYLGNCVTLPGGCDNTPIKSENFVRKRVKNSISNLKNKILLYND